jgi:hypothetical protein
MKFNATVHWQRCEHQSFAGKYFSSFLASDQLRIHTVSRRIAAGCAQKKAGHLALKK